jgi:hypothetical protein
MSAPTTLRIRAARDRLEAALAELAAVESDLDEVTVYALAICRGDVERLVRRLTGVLARQTERPDDGPAAA